ncbi:MAG: ribonuclease M5 [Candidatus Izimaplasma sp.]|nr:ribonuclease M5 [Candidatus Izimaplasma bacterium]
MNKQIIVVEGNHDQVKINSIYPNLQCITTNGSEISDKKLNLIYQLSKENEVILFLDPDTPGKKIMQKILNTNGKYTLAYIKKEKAISKNRKKVGIEHAKENDIRDALENKIEINNQESYIKLSDLYNRGLVNKRNANINRIKVCDSLEIPVSNGKTFLKMINLLDISLERVDEILNEKT